MKLKPYRGEPITRTVSYMVPKEQKAGLLNLTVRGGGFFSLSALLKKLGAEAENPKPTRKPPKSFEEMMNEFAKRDRNNDIVVEPAGASDMDEDGIDPEKKPKLKLTEKEKAARDTSPAKPDKSNKSKPTASLLKPAKTDKKDKACLTTDYIVEGDSELSIEIVAEVAR